MKYFFFGNSVIIEKELDKISKAFGKIDPEKLNFFKFGGQVDIGRITDAIFSPPFLGEKKLIYLRNLLSENDKKVIKDLLRKLAKTPNFSSIVWTESGQELEKNTLIKEIIGSRFFEVKNLSALNPVELANWIKKKALAEELTFSGSAMSKLISLTNGSLDKIDNECEKLFLHTKSQNKSEIGPESVELLIKGQGSESVFKFLDAIAQKDKKKALISLHMLLEEGQSELYVVSMLAYQFRSIYSIKELKSEGLTDASIAKELKVHPFTVRKNSAYANSLSFERIEKNFFLLEDFDAKVKRGLYDPRLAIFLLANRLCQ